MSDKNTAKVKKAVVHHFSKMRKTYLIRLILRCIAFFFFLYLYLKKPEQLEVLHGMNFFKEFSPLHVLWIVWVIDMLIQIIPSNANVSIGSLKLFKRYFKENKNTSDKDAMKKYFKTANISASIVFLIWVILISAIGFLHQKNVLHEAEMFMISVAFYVFDVICVVIWCPFRLIMRTRCCTTCRIFNWDHLMMYTPMLFIKGFYSISLIALATVVFILWEFSLLIHPERFWERTNCSLLCSKCNDKLCPQIHISKIKRLIKQRRETIYEEGNKDE